MARKKFTKPGLSHDRYDHCDYYRGTQAELIAAGICKAEWFPNAPAPFLPRPSRLKRSFEIEGPHGLYFLRQEQPYSKGRWSVTIPCGEAEQERREKESEAGRECHAAHHQNIMADKESREERAKQARIEAIIKALPPFVPGSMTEGEKHLMRVVRGLHDLHYTYMADMAERLLDRRDEFVEEIAGEEQREQAAAETQRLMTKLRIVVNNDKGAK